MKSCLKSIEMIDSKSSKTPGWSRVISKVDIGAPAKRRQRSCERSASKESKVKTSLLWWRSSTVPSSNRSLTKWTTTALASLTWRWLRRSRRLPHLCKRWRAKIKRTGMSRPSPRSWSEAQPHVPPSRMISKLNNSNSLALYQRPWSKSSLKVNQNLSVN